MENIKLKDGKFYVSEDVEINVDRLEAEIAEMVKSIAEQQGIVDKKQEIADYIRSQQQK
jgi:hypothetical protein